MKKTILKFLGLAVFCGLVAAANAETTALAGLGTAADPYQLGSVDDLRFMANAINGKAATPSGGTAYYIAHYVLTADIDFADVTDWPQIATSTAEGINFQGTLDGAGKRILNFGLGYKKNGAGLFYTMQGGAVVRNVTFDGASVGDRSSGNQCGIVSGYAYGNVTFENVTIANSKVWAFGKVGSILGQAADFGGTTTFRNCRVVDTTVRGTYNCGGLCGLSLNNCVVENCDVKGVEFKPDDSASKYVALDTVARNGDKAQRVTGLFWKYPYGSVTYYYAGWGDYYCDYKYEEWTLDAPADSYLADGLPHDIEVAEVVDVAGAATRYRTLAEAVANVKAGWTVTLLVNCEEAVSAPALPFTFEGNRFAGTIAPAEGYKLGASPIAGDTSVRHVAEDDDSALSASWIKVASGFYADGSSYDLSSNYYITSKEGLKYFADVVNGFVADFYPTGTNPFGGKTVHLLSDIDLNNEEWTPIGFDYQQGKKQSYAAFDGGSRTISNLKVTKFQTAEAKKYGVGLFGRVGDASSFRDLAFCNVTLRGYEYVAALFGQAANTVRVENVRVTGEVAIEASRFSGIVAGHASGKCEFVGCAVDAAGSIRTSATTGGIIGYGGQAAGCLVADCLVKDVTVDASGSMATSVRCGAVAGEFYQGLITNCAVRGVTVAAAADKLRVGGIVGGSGVTDLVVVDCLTDGETTVQGKSEFTQSGDLSSENLIVGWNIVWTEESKVNGGVFECLADSRVGAGYCKRARGTTPETWKVVPCEIQPASEQETAVEEKVVDANGKELDKESLTSEQKAAVVEAVAETKQKVVESIVSDPVVAGADTQMEKTISENRDAVVAAVAGAAQELGVNVDEVKGQIEEKIAKLAAGEPTEDTSKYLSINIGTVNAKVVVGDEVKATPEKLVYEVKPIVKTEVTSVIGGSEVKTVIETQLPNEAVRQNPVTFVLEVFDPKATRAMVKHTSDDDSSFGTEVFSCPIWADTVTGKRYITITTSHFSTFEITYSSEIVVETAETIGILKIEKDGMDVVAAAVPFKAESFDALVTTGAQTGDEVAGASSALGAPFWYARASDNGVPLTFAGLVDTIPEATVEAGTAEAPVATLLVNPNRTTADLLAELSGTVSEGDEIALAGGDVRYVYKNSAWSLVTKGNRTDEGDTPVYGDDKVTAVASIPVEGSRAVWYVSKGGTPTVTWADGSVGEEVVNGEAGAMTYGAANWAYEKTAFENDAFPHSYVRFVCDADGVTYAFDVTDGKTVFLGRDGLNSAGFDPATASFKVALLGDDKGVIAESAALTLADLAEAKALDANYMGNVEPAVATAQALFSGFTVPDNGEFDALTNAFDGVAKVGVGRKDGALVYTVRLSSDVTGPVTLADNLGNVVLDLNGHSVTGLAATAEADAGNAIVIAGSLAGATTPTALSIANTGAADAKVVGGRGADGVFATGGAVAIAYDPATVTVDDPSSLVAAGANGATKTAWAWCACTAAPASVPYGVSYDAANGKYLFWGCDENEAAKFDFKDIADWAIADDAIHFADGPVNVACLTVSSAAPDALRFVGGAATVLSAQGDASVFDVTATDAQARSWEKLGFASADAKSDEAVAQCGGAICMRGGRMTVADCDFVACEAYENGGAIAAIGLAADSLVTNSVFRSNASSKGNGYGGAVYATGKTDGLTLSVVDSAFVGNLAVNGGAIAAIPLNLSDEKPIALSVRNVVFEGNAAYENGGAIVAFADVEAEAGTTTFDGNFAGETGGAIAVWSLAEGPTAAQLTFGRGVGFVGNVVSNDVVWTWGGAISFVAEGGSLAAEGVAFVGNAAKSGDLAVGGALDLSLCGAAAIDTCVFDDNEVVGLGEGGFAGAAIAAVFEDTTGQTLAVGNSTFRRSGTEALYVVKTATEIVNCVVVGNGDGTTYADIATYGADVDMSYTAYFAFAHDGGTVTEANNLAGRTAESTYAGDTLKLRETGLNLVASLGLPQTADDFEGVPYGSKPAGYSMGAYEAAQVPVTVTLKGDKVYDGEATSNGCVWAWSFSTNGVPVEDAYCAPDIEDVKTAFEIAAWDFSDKDVGFYASTNAAKTVAAELAGCEQFRNALAFVYEGSITPSPAALVIVVDPEDNRWTGGEIKPTVTVRDPFTDAVLVKGADYVFHYEDNADPTAEAKVVVDALGNFEGQSGTNFWITAYKVVSTFDGAEGRVPSYYQGATGQEDVVVCDTAAVPGYCFDWQNSVTNGTAQRVDDGMLVITMQYCTDANGDGVPDKFQKKMAAKVVNGTWDGVDGYDRTVWVTLTNGVGQWSSTGTGKVAGLVPDVASGTAGSNYTKDGAGWLAFRNGQFAVVDPATLSVGADTAQFLLYAYLRKGDTGHSLGGRIGGRTGKTYTLEEMFSSRMTFTGLSVSGDMVTLGTKLTVTDTTANDKSIYDAPLANTKVSFAWSPTLGGETSGTVEATTDADGNATFEKPDADSAFFQLAE